MIFMKFSGGVGIGTMNSPLDCGSHPEYKLLSMPNNIKTAN